MADFEVDDVLRTFETPPQNATKDELLQCNSDTDESEQALKETQLQLAQAEVELRAKDKLIKELRAAGGKNKSKENPLNYLAVIIPMGKKFGFMHEPWASPAIFAARPNVPPPQTNAEEVEALFKDPKLYRQFLTHTLYEYVPEKYHQLIDPDHFPDFRGNFISHLGVGRSSGVDRLKTSLDTILADQNIAKIRDDLLYHPGEDKSHPPSAYPPIFDASLKKDMKTFMMNPVGLMKQSLRCMVFGPSSIKGGGKTKPAGNTMGFAWKLDQEGLTFGSIAFTLVALLFILSGADESFQEKGKISKIPFQSHFHAYKKRLMKNAGSAGIRNIVRYWHKIVFAGVQSATAFQNEGMNSSDGEDAEFADAMAAVALDDGTSDSDTMHVVPRTISPVDHPISPVNPVALVDNDPPSDTVPASDNGASVVVSLGGDQGRGRGNGRGRGRGSRGRGRGRGRGRVIESGDESEAPPAQAPRTRCSIYQT
ncbi:hypothetical protein K438DRAFT_2082728 [Mycena galopus ATCC 62051]|nr:hypothetical protein K438DRAFT_2082728 [Mycena galopus ATCC 62051]